MDKGVISLKNKKSTDASLFSILLAMTRVATVARTKNRANLSEKGGMKS